PRAGTFTPIRSDQWSALPRHRRGRRVAAPAREGLNAGEVTAIQLEVVFSRQPFESLVRRQPERALEELVVGLAENIAFVLIYAAILRMGRGGSGAALRPQYRRPTIVLRGTYEDLAFRIRLQRSALDALGVLLQDPRASNELAFNILQ